MSNTVTKRIIQLMKLKAIKEAELEAIKKELRLLVKK